MIATFVHDLRIAVRRLAHAPGFSLAVLLMLALGIALGLCVAWAALRLLQAHLFGMEGAQAGVVGVGVLAMLIAALVAVALPAWRASRTAAMALLRG